MIPDIFIAGAGAAGLAAAAALRGHDVLVLERDAHAGGQVATIERAGMRGPQPFFPMELVRGQPLTDYANALTRSEESVGAVQSRL